MFESMEIKKYSVVGYSIAYGALCAGSTMAIAMATGHDKKVAAKVAVISGLVGAGIGAAGTAMVNKSVDRYNEQTAAYLGMMQNAFCSKADDTTDSANDLAEAVEMAEAAAEDVLNSIDAVENI